METRREVNKKLQKYFYPSLAGLIGVLVGCHYYPPLDSERLAGCGVCLVFLPVVPHIVASARRRLASCVEWLQKLYLGCGSALLLIAACTIANGALDSSSARTVSAVVVQKAIYSGKYSTTRVVWTPSWRPDKDKERLEVSRELYRNLKVGEAIVVDMHPGVFGMPWYSRVAPE
jgi:hypothetical protein